MLSTLENLQKIPILKNLPVDFLNLVLAGADRAIKTYLKRNIESYSYTEYYSGNGKPELVLRQYPVSNTGLEVYFDPNGYFGQVSGSFAASTQLTQGSSFVLVTDDTPKGLAPTGQSLVSNRGLLLRIGGTSLGAFGWYPDTFYGGKLAGYRMPWWPLGQGNIKVVYTAGYTTIPDDLVYACNMLAAYMARNLPTGAPLNSETLGGYSYTVAQAMAHGGPPELGAIATTLAGYRETSI